MCEINEEMCIRDRHKTIPVVILGLFGVNAHLTEIQVSKDVRRGQAAARMTAPGTVGGFDHTHALSLIHISTPCTD